MPTDDAKQVLKILNPLRCTQVRQWLVAWGRDALDAEEEEEIRDHVLVCDECLLAFTAVVEHQVDAGALPLQPWPSTLPLPPRDLVTTASAPALAPGAAAAPVRAAVPETLGILWEEVTAEGRRCLEGAVALWRLMFPEPSLGPGLLALPAMGEDMPGLMAEVMDETWQPRDRRVAFTIALPGGGPVLTADGRFTLTLQTPETQWHGAEVLCTLVLVESRRVSFSGVVQPAPTGVGEEVRFAATALPQRAADVPIPLEFIQLALRPAPGLGQ